MDRGLPTDAPTKVTLTHDTFNDIYSTAEPQNMARERNPNREMIAYMSMTIAKLRRRRLNDTTM
jgi:hypothetical protein